MKKIKYCHLRNTFKNVFFFLSLFPMHFHVYEKCKNFFVAFFSSPHHSLTVHILDKNICFSLDI